MSYSSASRHYREKGFVNLPGVLDPDLVARTRAELETLYRSFPADTGARLTVYHPDGIDAGQARIDNPHLISDAVSELLASPRLHSAIRDVAGFETAQVWYCHALRKPAHIDTANHVGWHQDGQYARFLSGDFLTAWIPLVEIDEDNSPLIYVAGSHLHGLVKGSGFSHKASLEKLKQDILESHPIAWNEETATGPEGFVSLHHSKLIHGSAANPGGHVRYSIACHLRSENNALLPEHDYKNAVAIIRDTRLSPVMFGKAEHLDFGGVPV